MRMIFDSAPGVVGAMVVGKGLPFAVAIGGTGFSPAFPAFSQIKAVLTGFQFGARSGIGVAHTLRDRIYVYAFGERMGEATVSGLAFPGVCNVPGSYTGFDGVFAYYELCRISTQGAPVRLIFGPNTVLFGFMYEFAFQLEDPQTGLGSFSFKFKVIPRGNFGLLRAVPWQARFYTSSLSTSTTGGSTLIGVTGDPSLTSGGTLGDNELVSGGASGDSILTTG